MAKKKYDYNKAYTVRFHDEVIDGYINKTFERFKSGFGSMNEFMARMCYEGAIARNGDEDLNKSFNYSEIRKILKRLESDKDDDKENFKMLKAKLFAEIKVNQGLLNYIIRLLMEHEQINSYWVNIDENKFNSLVEDELNLLRNKLLLEVYNEQ